MYKIIASGVLRLRDSVAIPDDSLNHDWRDYQAWLLEGNTPEPADVATTYWTQREAAYPSIADQLDMLYWDVVNGTTVWRDTIAAVKARFPAV